MRCLARYTVNAWRMLVPEAAMPRASRTLGRWQIVVGGVATETQVCYLSAAEARLLVHKARAVSTCPGTLLTAADQEMFPEHGLPGCTSAIDAELVTLRRIRRQGVCPWALPPYKKRLQRAGRKAGRCRTRAGGQGRQRADLYER